MFLIVENESKFKILCVYGFTTEKCLNTDVLGITTKSVEFSIQIDTSTAVKDSNFEVALYNVTCEGESKLSNWNCEFGIGRALVFFSSFRIVKTKGLWKIN